MIGAVHGDVLERHGDERRPERKRDPGIGGEVQDAEFAGLPTGLRGLLIAGILSAAISSLDSILAALSQISLTMFYKPFVSPDADEEKLLRVSRLLVIFWGAVLAVMAWQFSASRLDLVTLAFSMTTYTWGPMLGLFLLSMVAKRWRVAGVGRSVVASILLVLFINEPQLVNPLFGTVYSAPLLAWPWLFPIGAACCFILSLRGRKPETLA